MRFPDLTRSIVSHRIEPESISVHRARTLRESGLIRKGTRGRGKGADLGPKDLANYFLSVLIPRPATESVDAIPKLRDASLWWVSVVCRRDDGEQSEIWPLYDGGRAEWERPLELPEPLRALGRSHSCGEAMDHLVLHLATDRRDWTLDTIELRDDRGRVFFEICITTEGLEVFPDQISDFLTWKVMYFAVMFDDYHLVRKCFLRGDIIEGVTRDAFNPDDPAEVEAANKAAKEADERIRAEHGLPPFDPTDPFWAPGGEGMG